MTLKHKDGKSEKKKFKWILDFAKNKNTKILDKNYKYEQLKNYIKQA